MIATLSGVLREKFPNAVIVDCMGVGYQVMTPTTVSEKLPKVGETVFFLIEFVVREDSHTLYGFLAMREKELFRRLLKVSGVGAKTALAMMSALSADECLAALAEDNVDLLARTPGIGKKTAERLVVDFRGSPLLTGAATGAGGTLSGVDADVEQALIALGYNKTEVKKALAALPQDGGDGGDGGGDVAARVRQALRFLSGRARR